MISRRFWTPHWLWVGIWVLMASVACGKKEDPKPKAKPLTIESIRISFPGVVPQFAKATCKGTFFRYEFHVANARYTDEGGGRLRDSVRLSLSLIDSAGKSVFGLSLKPPSPFPPALKTSRLRWMASACTDQPLGSGTYTFQIHAVDKKGGGMGTGKRTFKRKGNPGSSDGGPGPLLPGHSRLANTGLQLMLPPGAQVKRGAMSGDEIVLPKHGAFMVRGARVRNLTLDKVVAQLERLQKMKIHGFLLKKGPGPGWTFALTYRSSWTHDPEPKLRFHQGFTRRGATYSCTGNPKSKAAALAFHQFCAAIR